MTPEEIHKIKNPICELCQNPFALPTLNSRFGTGKIVGGVKLCNKCIPSYSIMKRYQNKTKRHLTEGERAKLAREMTIRGGN